MLKTIEVKHSHLLDIEDGDTISYDTAAEVKSGDIAVIRIMDEAPTVQRLFFSEDGASITTQDGSTYKKEAVQIIGKAKSIIRDI